jgi:CzcA family heavy metal efflux pump
VGRFAVRQAVPILFLIAVVCAAGAYAALHMPSAVFPQTDFPRVVVMVENGMMPADEMMATVTRPVEEGMKDIQGCQTIRSSTGRGTAEIDLFFSWDVDMRQAEMYVLGRLGQIRAGLPATVTTDVYRMTFSTFPIVGISLTGQPGAGDDVKRWETAEYAIKPRLLRIPGVARVEILGGHRPEFQVEYDPQKLAAARLTAADLVDALTKNNLAAAAGMHQENHSLYLAVVDGRVRSAEEIANLTAGVVAGHPVRIGDVAKVQRGAEPAFDVVTANGTDAVLLNIYSQPDGSTTEIADQLHEQIRQIKHELAAGQKLTFFYDQSLLVKDSVRSVWEAIAFGLILTVVIVYLFLRSWGMTLVTVLVIPVTVLFTVLVMKALGLSFNLMTLGGIAAAIGLVIDDAIVVVEAIHAKAREGLGRLALMEAAIGEILPPLIGSTLTPVVVFIPLAYLTGVAGIFFRALAITMVVALLTSLMLALTFTPSLAAWFIPAVEMEAEEGEESMGFAMVLVVALYQFTVRLTLKHRWFTLGICGVVMAATVVLYGRLQSDFLPAMDEGGFIIDYVLPPGTSLAESDRELRQAEDVLKTIPEVESFSRRTGAALGVHLVEPNTGDFLVKLRASRKRKTAVVIDELRDDLYEALPRVNWEFPGILTDLIGDLTWSDEAIEVKFFSSDTQKLEKLGPRIEETLKKIPGVVDTTSGLIYTGPSISLRVRDVEARRFGLTTTDIAAAVNAALLGQTASTVAEADRVINVRVRANHDEVDRLAKIRALPIRTPTGAIVRVDEVTEVTETPGQLELERDNLRQNIAATANLQGRDLGSAMVDVKKALADDPELPADAIEFGGLYEQQRESFHNLTIVLAAALALVFLVALIEFGTVREPIAIVSGAALSSFGIVVALLITHTSLNIVTFLGAIIGMGIVHKNGLLMLDSVKHLRATGVKLYDALVWSGRRRLRPVLMTSLAAALGMLPLAYGIGSADMLRPLAIAVIGAVCVSVLLSLVATPTIYYVLCRLTRSGRED